MYKGKGMNLRYCILTSPRSGSKLLEDTIFRMTFESVTPEVPAIKLGEFLHYKVHEYIDTNKKKFSTIKPFDSDERVRFRQEMMDIIENKNNSMTMRIFPQPWHGIDYLFNFLHTLKQNGFVFVYLERNLFDRVISLSVAQKTNLWVRLKNFTQTQKHIQISENNKIHLDTEEVLIEMKALMDTDSLLDIIFSEFGGEIINYENFESDCNKIGIKTGTSGHSKTYEIEYKHLIENYDEVANFIKNITNGL